MCKEVEALQEVLVEDLVCQPAKIREHCLTSFIAFWRIYALQKNISTGIALREGAMKVERR